MNKKDKHNCKSRKQHVTVECTDYESISSLCDNISNNTKIRFCIEVARTICCEMPDKENHIIDCNFLSYHEVSNIEDGFQVLEVSDVILIPQLTEQETYFTFGARLRTITDTGTERCQLHPTRINFNGHPYPCKVLESDCD